MSSQMSVHDEIREQHKKTKDMTLQGKLSYFWYYYKIHAIVAILVIIFISIPFAPLKAQNAMKKQVVSQRFSFYNSCHRNKRYTTNHGEVSGLSSLLDDRIFICVGCFFKHK